MNLLYIILPVHNRKELTLEFIHSLLKQSFVNFRLILVDDGSTDGTSEAVKELIPDVVVLKGNGNWWWAGSIQQGYNWIKSNVKTNEGVLIINDDLVFDENYLQKGIEYLKANPKSVVLSAAYSKDNHDHLEDCGVIYDFKTSEMNAMPVHQLDQLNCASTRGLFMTTEDFLKTGGMHPVLLPHYFSDYEFTIRAKRKHGLAIKCFLDLKVYMDNSTSGIREIEYKTFREYIRKSCDKRYKGSPVYTFNYFMLAFPFPYNIKLAFPYLKNFLKTALRLIFKS